MRISSYTAPHMLCQDKGFLSPNPGLSQSPVFARKIKLPGQFPELSRFMSDLTEAHWLALPPGLQTKLTEWGCFETANKQNFRKLHQRGDLLGLVEESADVLYEGALTLALHHNVLTTEHLKYAASVLPTLVQQSNKPQFDFDQHVEALAQSLKLTNTPRFLEWSKTVRPLISFDADVRTESDLDNTLARFLAMSALKFATLHAAYQNGDTKAKIPDLTAETALDYTRAQLSGEVEELMAEQRFKNADFGPTHAALTGFQRALGSHLVDERRETDAFGNLLGKMRQNFSRQNQHNTLPSDFYAYLFAQAMGKHTIRQWFQMAKYGESDFPYSVRKDITKPFERLVEATLGETLYQQIIATANQQIAAATPYTWGARTVSPPGTHA